MSLVEILNIFAFINLVCGLLSITVPWIKVEQKQSIPVSNGVCQLYGGETIGLFDTVCSFDAWVLNSAIRFIQPLVTLSFVPIFWTFVVTNWLKSQKMWIVSCLSFVSFVMSSAAWIVWIAKTNSGTLFNYTWLGIYSTVASTFCSFLVLCGSLRQGRM